MLTKVNAVLRLFCFFLISSALPAQMFAHATPLQYVPAASSVLGQSPTKIQIHFSERIEPRVSNITVLAPDGSRADLSNSALDRVDPRIYSVGLRDSGAGTYTVSWSVISSDDGHFTKGAYVFSVGIVKPGAAAESGGFQTIHSSSVPEALTLAIELIGSALILGALLVLAFIWRPVCKHFPDAKLAQREFFGRFQFLLITGCILSLAGGIAYLLYKADELALLQETNFAFAWSSFLSTNSALFTIYRMIGAGFILIACLAMRKRILSAEHITSIEYAFFAALVLIDFARARISHAAASTFAPTFGVLMNFVHLFFKDAWVGGIIVVVVLLSPIIRKSRNVTIAAFALTSFSRIASISLGVAGVTGVFVVWLHLKSFSNVLTTDWGKRFAILSVFAVFLLLLRLVGQLFFEPAIIDAIGDDDEPRLRRVLSWLRFTLPAEMAMGIAILAVTSLLIITTPPIAPHFRSLRMAISQGVTLSLTEQPYERGKFLITAVDPLNGAGADVRNLVVTLSDPAAGIGPIIAPVAERFVGGFVFDENLLAPAGNWIINVAAQRAGAYDATAAFQINYPREINESDAHSADRTFGSFEAIHILIALVILAASMVLYRKSTRLIHSVLSASHAEASPSTVAPTFVRSGAWIAPLILIAVVVLLTGGLPAVSSGVLDSSFQRACEGSNIMNVWHESVPERDGKATSDFAMPGCTVGLGLGQFHFVDPREFDYFVRLARARAQMATSPTELAPGVPATLTFSLRDLQGNPVQDLVLDHNRILHVVIASQDFSVFAHIHAEDFQPVAPEMLKAAVFPVHYTFPKPGKYLVSVDYTERAYIFSDQFYLNVGTPGPISEMMSGMTMGPMDGMMTAPINGSSDEKPSAPRRETFSLQENVDGYNVTLKTSPTVLKASAPATLDYHIERSGKPFTEMNPYLAVPMHLSIIRDDLMSFLHIHGLLPVSFVGKLLGESVHASHLFLPNNFGPDIEATDFSFPSPGIYHIFGEFSASGKIVVTHFTVKVE